MQQMVPSLLDFGRVVITETRRSRRQKDGRSMLLPSSCYSHIDLCPMYLGCGILAIYVIAW